MDVRIGYSVDLEEVPDKIADMLSDVSTRKASHLTELAMHMIELGHHEMGVTLLDDARKALSDIDRSLNEAHLILSGYLSAKNSPATDPIPPEGAGDTDAD